MRTRIPLLSVLAVAAVFLLGGARAAPAQQVVKFGEGQTLTISGFISATMFYDHGLFGSFGQGQNAEFAAVPLNQPVTDKGIFDGDVRNAGYIATWIELIKADKRALFTAASKASKAADYLRGLALAEPAAAAA